MTELRPLLEACPPREIQQAGDQYAADLMRGLEEELGTPESAGDFLETTHLTKAMGDFVRMAMGRVVEGRASTSPAVYQLNSRYGGGKTHSLLLLAAAARHPGLAYWEGLRDGGERARVGAAKVVAFTGEHFGVDGMQVDDEGRRARSLAGYLLHCLGGAEALERFAEGDRILGDPGSEAFRRLIGDEPVVIVLDELAHYINRVNQRVAADRRLRGDGVLTTLSALAKAVIDSPRAVLVITTPEDAHELLGDAMHADALKLREMLERVSSQLARVMHPLAPSESADLPAILRRRLFYSVDEAARRDVAGAYAGVASRNGRSQSGLSYEDFYEAYPFHPLLLRLITGHLAASRNFQRVRGTLRLLGNALVEMRRGGSVSAAMHAHHLTLRATGIRDEVVNRLEYSELDAAIDTDIVGAGSTAERIGNPLAEAAATTMLLGTIGPKEISGLYADEIADALLSPEQGDFGVVADAVREFLARSIYVDDSPDTQQKRFSKDANVMRELLEAKRVILADTSMMSELLRKAIGSAYAPPSRETGLELCIFPSPQSNAPDNVDRAVLGVVNPDYWNWVGAAEPANGMSNRELVDLLRQRSGGGDGSGAPREYKNNALLLAAHDADLSRIRDDLATLEAAERLLRNRTRPLPEGRRRTLEGVRADCEKTATLGIQNKFTHLFCAGNEEQLQWPEPNSHWEHRALESITDAVGKGQANILDALRSRALQGAARLHPDVWKRILPIANEAGSTLGELRGYFARTPDARIIVDDATWRALVASAVRDGSLHVVTRSGEIGPTGYDPGWRVWARGYEPPAAPPDGVGTAGGDGGGVGTTGDGGGSVGTAGGDVPPIPPTRLFRFDSGMQPGRSAYADVERFMLANGHSWEGLERCEVKGVRLELADWIASVAQGDDGGIAIDFRAQGGGAQVSILGAPLSAYKDYAPPARRILERAGIVDVDVTVRLDGGASERILGKLRAEDEARITVWFGQG